MKKVKYSYGLEIEFIDADRKNILLPEGCKWDHWEMTLINSDGRAINPKKKSEYTIGGEICTQPTSSIENQLKIAENCLKVVKKAKGEINYRCNLHAHVGLNWDDFIEEEQLEMLKKIQRYSVDNYEDTVRGTMGEGQFIMHPDMNRAFFAHYKEKIVPPYRQELLDVSRDLLEFWFAFFQSRSGEYYPVTFYRSYVNVHSFFKTKSIEFRCFWATLDIFYIENCLKFSEMFIEQALTDQIPVKEWINNYQFPPELPFDKKLEESFNATKAGSAQYHF